MPGPLLKNQLGATAQEVDELKGQIHELRQTITALASAIERKPNPAPQMQDSFVMQLLLEEKQQNARLADKIAEYQDPLSQIERLQAFASLMPKSEDNGSKMLEEVISTVGGIVAAKMVQGETSAGGGEPDPNHAPDEPEEY